MTRQPGAVSAMRLLLLSVLLLVTALRTTATPVESVDTPLRAFASRRLAQHSAEVPVELLELQARLDAEFDAATKSDHIVELLAAEPITTVSNGQVRTTDSVAVKSAQKTTTKETKGGTTHTTTGSISVVGASKSKEFNERPHGGQVTYQGEAHLLKTSASHDMSKDMLGGQGTGSSSVSLTLGGVSGRVDGVFSASLVDGFLAGGSVEGRISAVDLQAGSNAAFDGLVKAEAGVNTRIHVGAVAAAASEMKASFEGIKMSLNAHAEVGVSVEAQAKAIVAGFGVSIDAKGFAGAVADFDADIQIRWPWFSREYTQSQKLQEYGKQSDGEQEQTVGYGFSTQCKASLFAGVKGEVAGNLHMRYFTAKAGVNGFAGIGVISDHSVKVTTEKVSIKTEVGAAYGLGWGHTFDVDFEAGVLGQDIKDVSTFAYRHLERAHRLRSEGMSQAKLEENLAAAKRRNEDKRKKKLKDVQEAYTTRTKKLATEIFDAKIKLVNESDALETKLEKEQTTLFKVLDAEATAAQDKHDKADYILAVDLPNQGDLLRAKQAGEVKMLQDKFASDRSKIEADFKAKISKARLAADIRGAAKTIGSTAKSLVNKLRNPKEALQPIQSFNSNDDAAFGFTEAALQEVQALTLTDLDAAQKHDMDVLVRAHKLEIKELSISRDVAKVKHVKAMHDLLAKNILLRHAARMDHRYQRKKMKLNHFIALRDLASRQVRLTARYEAAKQLWEQDLLSQMHAANAQLDQTFTKELRMLRVLQAMSKVKEQVKTLKN